MSIGKRIVIKQDGSEEPFDIQKIRRKTIPAVEGTSVSHLELESKLELNLARKITSHEIQETLVLLAKGEISADTPDYNLISGRLASKQLFSEVWKNTHIDLNEFKKHVHYLVRNKYYRSDILNMYSDEDLDTLGTLLDGSRDYNVVFSQIAILRSKYLTKNQRGCIEYPSTADMTNSMILASVEPSKDKQLGYSKKYYDALSTYELSLATSFKANLRLKDGNTGSCFVGETGDSIYQLLKTYSDMAIISKEGGGIGWYFGKVRPGGAKSRNVPKSHIINKWLKIVNDIAVAVDQKGISKGAITTALPWWHMDIIDFCEIKSELSGDLRDKCFDIFPQVVVDAYFIDRVYANADVYLFDQYEFKNLTGIDITELSGEALYNAHNQATTLIEEGKLKHYEKIAAKKLWAKFLSSWIEYGDFYISHVDNINISNYLYKYGNAKCVNLCTESWSLSKVATKWSTTCSDDYITTTSSDGFIHSCNLASINVANIYTMERLKEVCYLAVRALDASVDLGTMPILEAKTAAEQLRNIGIGVVGEADYMAHHGVLYDTEEGLDLGEKLAEQVAYFCYQASIELAKERGAYPLFELADYSKIFGRTPKELTKMSKNNFNWEELQRDICTYGIRNFYLLSYAPNTRTALGQGVTPSYLPAHSKDGSQKLSGLVTPILPKYIATNYWHYKTKFQYKTEDLIRYTRRKQRWIDTGISMECPINPDLTNIKRISDEILDGFRTKELKAVYYCLTLDKNNKSSKTKDDDGCTDCKN